MMRRVVMEIVIAKRGVLGGMLYARVGERRFRATSARLARVAVKWLQVTFLYFLSRAFRFARKQAMSLTSIAHVNLTIDPDPSALIPAQEFYVNLLGLTV